MRWPDYENGILNIVCSLQKHLGLPSRHGSLPLCDAVLEKCPKNILFLVFDGLGARALKRHLPPESFLRRHTAAEISSVFPPTTTAAMTALYSGLSPAEHAWLGWSLYFEEIGAPVDIFPNTLTDVPDFKQAADYHLASRFMPYKNAFTQMTEAGVEAHEISAFGDCHVESLDEMFDALKDYCSKDGKKVLMAYWHEPDHTMHETGCGSEKVRAIVADIDARVERFCEGLADAAVFVTADHGHKDVRYYTLTDYPDLLAMLYRPIAIEARAAAFFVRPEYLNAFPDAFRAHFGDAFLLLSKKEVTERELFGPGKPHPRFEGFLGEYLSVATAEYAIRQSELSPSFPSAHAGLTDEEMLVPLVIVEKEK
ncbi:MAG: alkaline phosphatase family protein [Clostridiaceae bacterium]|nr:alkaline phosphatase family protein [Eubacteriales bacterium]